MGEIKVQTRRDSQLFAQICRDLLRAGARVRFCAHGASMQPNISDGEAVIVTPADHRAIAPGAIAFTSSDNGLLVHRVIATHAATGAIITRGDAGQRCDPPTTEILGEVTAVQRSGKTFSLTGPLARSRQKIRIFARRAKLAAVRKFQQARFSLRRSAVLTLAILATSAAAFAQVPVTVTQVAAPTSGNPGATITFTDTLMVGTGGGRLTAPTLSQVLPAQELFQSVSGPGGTWTCGGPPVNTSGTVSCVDSANQPTNTTITVTVVVTIAAGTAAQTLNSTVTVTSASIMIGTTSATAPVTVNAVADLSVTQSVAPTSVSGGSNLTYTDTVNNAGPSPAAAPVMTQATPTNTKFVSVTPATGWTCTSPAVGATGNVVCTDGSAFASGAAAAVNTIVVVVNSGTAPPTVIAGSVTVSSATSDSNNANNTAISNSTVTSADLSVAQTAAPATVGGGGTLTFTNTITNNGAGVANSAVLTQATPTNTVFASVAPPAGWTCTNPAVGATGNVVCTDSNPLANAGTAIIPIAVTVNAGTAQATIITGSATVSSATSDPTAANNTATSTATVGSADLAVVQAATAPVVAAGTNITFNATVTNNGPSASQSVVLYENIPANTTFQSIGAIPAGWTCTTPAAGGTTPVSCTNPSVANGATANFAITLQIAAAAAAETVIQNIMSITSNSTLDPVAANNTSVATILVGVAGDADLQLTLTANPTPVYVSSPLTYNITVKNLGVAIATATMVTDTIPAGVTYVSSAASQGTCSLAAGVVTCNLGTLAAAASATVAIQVTAPGTATSVSDTASTSSAVTDPFLSNNSATIITFVQPLSCGTPAHDGAGGTLTGSVNTYYAPATPQVASGTTAITLGAGIGATTPIAVGDLILIIQMQDAAINSTNTGAYGDGTPGDPAYGATAVNNSGRYEFVTATSAVPIAGGSLTFRGAGAASGLINTYTNAAYSAGVQGQRTFQVIRVPQHQSATLSSTLAPPAWNGTVGGVLAIDVAGQLTLGGTVSADNLGFRGGGGRKLTGGAGTATDYETLASNAANGSKGEGISGTPQYLSNLTFTAVLNSTIDGYPNGSYARGAPGNAGGGATDSHPAANDDNSGGGGGSNGSGGGLGGYAWNTAALGNGFGGAPFAATISTIIMGGGGGAGTTNDGTADPANANPAGINSSGSAGGGIIILHAGSVIGTGTLSANGQSSLNVLNDGGGGAGAGGSIELLSFTSGITGATINANGGNGGNTWLTNAAGAYPGSRHGPGGGGGGGVIFTTSAPAAANVAPGVNGVSTNIHDSYGATPGAGNGIVVTNLGPAGFTQSPGARAGAECAVADVSVTNSGTPNPVVTGGQITYTQVVNNTGPQSALNVVFSEAIPTNTTLASFSSPAGWTCTVPAVGATGNISCTLPNNDSGVMSTFTLVVQLGAGAVSGSTISDTASVSSGIDDNNLSNNSATVNTLVAAPPTADIAVTNVPSVSTVVAGGSYSYAQTIRNNGPSAATNVTFTQAIPANTTFASFPTPSGWTCSTPAVGATGNVTCTIASLAVGASANFTLGLNVNAGATVGTVITDTVTGASSVTDPNSSNNSAAASVTVSTPPQADLGVTKVGNPNVVLAGANITYTIVVTNAGPAAATLAVLTDPFPTSTTYVSGVTPSGWTCSTTASTLTCTNPSVAANSSATFMETFTVNPGTVAGTVISNTASVSSGAPDANTANNSATETTPVTSPSAADLSITKTASPEPVNQGDVLTYSIIVSNNGPAAASAVVVTDTLPTEVSYVSSSSTVGSCTQSSGTVTCNLGTLTNGQIASITINTTAVVFDDNMLAVNTASVSSSTPDPDNTNNSASASSTIAAPNLVQLTYFKAYPRAEGGNVLEWHTREELRNLGFNVYREDAAGRHRLNPSIIAGAALFIRGALPAHGAKTYQWIDLAGNSGSSYTLEDVDLNGTLLTHGPVQAEALTSESSASARRSVSAASSTNSTAPEANYSVRAANATAPAVSASVSLATTTTPAANSMLLRQMNQLVAQSAALPVRSVITPAPLQPQLLRGELRSSLETLPAVKISVQSEGWYRVTREQLAAFGFHLDANSQYLQLFAEGVEQPMQILSGGSALEFYGTGIDTPYSGTRVYWLVKGSRPGKRIVQAPVSNTTATGPASFPFTVIHEDRTTYFATLLNGEDNDNFFGAVVFNEPVDQTLNVAHSDATSGLPATLDVRLQGGTDQQAHRVSVVFNGASLGEMDFANQANVTQTFPVDASSIHDGTNTVTLNALNGDNDVSLVQSIQLHYAHTYAADSNWLRATVQSGSVAISGFTSSQIYIYDVTDPLAITQLAVSVQQQGQTYSATATVPGSSFGPRTILAFSEDQISAASALTFHQPSNLAQARNNADLIYIAHSDFVDSLAPLKQYRESRGYEVQIVTTDQIFDAYNFGEASPYAIRQFVQHAVTAANRQPQSLLLVGDASLDPRNYLGFGAFDFVPTRLIETAAFKTASDDWLSDFKQDGFATLPTGRLPVRTAADTALVVAKILDYEKRSYAGTWSQQALLISDLNEGTNFSAEAQVASTMLPFGVQATKITGDGQNPDITREQILSALNSGSLLVNYTGHGSTEQWSFTDLLDNNSAQTLSNGKRLPVYLLMDCLNGFFQDVYTQSLAESLLLAPNGGGVAVWASSGFTNAPPQAFLDQALLRELAQDPRTPLGLAILNAKSLVSDSEVRRTWILFGDPTTKLEYLRSPRLRRGGLPE